MDLFVYGTLRLLPLLRAVGGEMFQTVVAHLDGYAVHPVAGDVVPMIRPDAGQTATGLLIKNVSKTAVARFDLYEGLYDYQMADVTVTADGAAHPAKVYLPPVAQPYETGPWSLEKWERDRSTLACLTAIMFFDRAPHPDMAAAKILFPMIEKQAWAQMQAQARDLPATTRYDPSPTDILVDQISPPHGAFFGLQQLHINHRQFDGTRSDTLTREVFLGIDAALVLPYDPVRDRVLLVEQIRMGPAVLGDTNPWVLEPIAGMIDAGETPEQAGLREAREEAGLTDLTLEKISAFYPSPGSSTDYFHAFLGLCDLPDTAQYSGGLASEAEDLRLHPMSFDTAMGLAQSGEITAGPLLMMLYWVALHRDRLRAAA